MKNHYATLGVLPSAETVVIRAVYKALVQRCHPDKFAGDKKIAEENVRALNEAYEVLSDETKRAAYDKELTGRTNNTEEYFSEEQTGAQPENDALAAAWKKSEEYYPDLAFVVDELGALSWRLAYAYKVHLIETKQFGNRRFIAQEMRENYFKLYFGSNPRIIDFAKILIGKKMNVAAKELNEAIVFFGASSDAELIIDKISKKHEISGVGKPDSFYQGAMMVIILLLLLMCFLLFMIKVWR